MEKGPERLSNLPKVTQLVSGEEPVSNHSHVVSEPVLFSTLQDPIHLKNTHEVSI